VADPNRMQDSRPTFLVTGAGPILSCSDGNEVNRVRSVVRRSSGTAQVSVWTRALTSSHHATAARLAGLQVHRSLRWGTLLSELLLEFLLEQQRPQQVVLGVPDEVLHDPLRLRIGGLTEVRPELVMRGEPDVIRSRHNPVRDHAALETAHPVGQHRLGCPVEGGEALRQHRQRRIKSPGVV